MFDVDSIPTSHAIFRYHIIDDRNLQKRNSHQMNMNLKKDNKKTFSDKKMSNKQLRLYSYIRVRVVQAIINEMNNMIVRNLKIDVSYRLSVAKRCYNMDHV